MTIPRIRNNIRRPCSNSLPGKGLYVKKCVCECVCVCVCVWVCVFDLKSQFNKNLTAVCGTKRGSDRKTNPIITFPRIFLPKYFSYKKTKAQFHQCFYAQLLHLNIPKVQKAAWLDCLFCAFGICACKSCTLTRWWNWSLWSIVFLSFHSKISFSFRTYFPLCFGTCFFAEIRN